MSDQIPLWAKALPSRMIFSEHELAGHSHQDRKRINQIREEIEVASQLIKKKFEEDGHHEAQIIGEVLPEGHQKLLSGSKTTRTDSAVEKWRITYEARQRISNITGDGHPVGSVEKGLLIFPGSHASLDQVDDDGKYINDVVFQVGDKITTHKKGSKCRVLQWAVKMRKDHPDLISKIDIMTQPASNCDSIILSWIVQQQINREPASLFIRDCFSASFAEEVRSVQFLGNQVPAEILGKLTQRLQVTDTDYARSFKSRFRHQLDEYRRDHRNSSQGKAGKRYQVGYYDIIRGVVAAEDELRNQNHQNSWVLAATIRNGLLAHLPVPSKGIMVTIADQEWASEYTKAGSTRIPSDWLEHRLSWLKDGVPIQPDFNLSERIKAAEDLIAWSYHGDDDGKAGKKYQVGYYDIIRGVVAAEDELRNQNHQNSWVLSATIRNGLLVHLPVPSKGIMVPIVDQEWASQFTKAGSTRIQSDWLEHRLSWLKDGVPIQPDFNLSGRIKSAEGLIAWSYHGDDDGKDQLEDGKDQHEEGKIEVQEASSGILDISDDVDEEMLMPASNSLFLQISPHLRKQHQWNKRRASYQELLESAKAKIMKTEDRAQKRDKLRSYARRMLKDKIKIMSRKEAISEIMPVAKRKASAKGSGKGKKLSSLLKESMKKKPSAIKNAQMNQVYQDGHQCGYYVISYMEQAAAMKDHGPASTGWPEDYQKQWKMRYEKLHKQILSEHDKLHQEKQDQEKTAQKIKEPHEKKIQRAEGAIKKIKDHEGKAYLAAQEALTSGSQYFKKEDLAEFAQIRILKASSGIGVCSKCHWSSGCLECSGKHAFKYHMGKEAAVAGVGYAQRHHLADHAGAVRFEHAWACIEAILERPFLNVLISPNAWEMGRGAQAMRQLISAGLAGRFKKTGFRKPKAAPQGELVAETNEIQVIEQRTSDKENLALQGQPAEVLAAPMPEVLESMKKLQLGWNATQSSIEILPKDSVQVLRHKLGENEIY
eukprot:symbB.v1.2.031211.t1/scaffold3598.1/size53462/1